MENNNESINSLNDEKNILEEELKTLDSETDKDRVSEINEKVNSLNDEIKTLEEADEDDVEAIKATNKKLYARAKTAEGFVLEGDKWVKKPKIVVQDKPKVEKVITDESIINKVLDKRELESLELSDELKKEIETYAKVQNISVKQALKSEYISFLQEKEEKKQKIDDASLGSNRKSRNKKDYSDVKATDFDLRTPEGKADFAKYQEWLKS